MDDESKRHEVKKSELRFRKPDHNEMIMMEKIEKIHSTITKVVALFLGVIALTTLKSVVDNIIAGDISQMILNLTLSVILGVICFLLFRSCSLKDPGVCYCTVAGKHSVRTSDKATRYVDVWTEDHSQFCKDIVYSGTRQFYNNLAVGDTIMVLRFNSMKINAVSEREFYGSFSDM